MPRPRFAAGQIAIRLDPHAAEHLPAPILDALLNVLEEIRVEPLHPLVINSRALGVSEVLARVHHADDGGKGVLHDFDRFFVAPQPRRVDVGIRIEVKGKPLDKVSNRPELSSNRSHRKIESLKRSVSQSSGVDLRCQLLQQVVQPRPFGFVDLGSVDARIGLNASVRLIRVETQEFFAYPQRKREIFGLLLGRLALRHNQLRLRQANRSSSADAALPGGLRSPDHQQKCLAWLGILRQLDVVSARTALARAIHPKLAGTGERQVQLYRAADRLTEHALRQGDLLPEPARFEVDWLDEFEASPFRIIEVRSRWVSSECGPKWSATVRSEPLKCSADLPIINGTNSERLQRMRHALDSGLRSRPRRRRCRNRVCPDRGAPRKEQRQDRHQQRKRYLPRPRTGRCVSNAPHQPPRSSSDSERRDYGSTILQSKHKTLLPNTQRCAGQRRIANAICPRHVLRRSEASL